MFARKGLYVGYFRCTQVKHLKKTAHINKSKIGTPVYDMIKTFKEGNNPRS
jgi:hypothetical protein